MRRLITAILTFFSLSTFAQNIDLIKKAKEITDEGKKLYKLEMAAWYGTDIFYENFKGPETIGGYFAYLDSETPKCAFFSKGENPQIIGVVSFGNIQIVETATIDFKKRAFKNEEKDLYLIRAKALESIRQDSIFKTYSNTSLNLIPTITDGERKVYVLTGPKNTGVVLFGNDYLITFDKQNNIVSKKELHKNLIPINFDLVGDKEVIATIHSHAPETGDFITPTDICTLMLYAKFAKWKEHIVMSQNYVSIWDCEKEELRVVTRGEFERSNEQ